MIMGLPRGAVVNRDFLILCEFHNFTVESSPTYNEAII